MIRKRSSRAFVAWAADIAGPRVVLERSMLHDFDLRRWPGGFSILQFDGSMGDFRYRLCGAGLRSILGRDLAGEYVSALTPEMAGPVREHVRAAVERRIPVGGRICLARSSSADPERPAIYEQVVWPLRYGLGPVGAVLILSLPVPENVAERSWPLSATGTCTWFDADGRPLTPSQLSANALLKKAKEP